MASELINVAEAARRLGCSVRTVYAAIHAGHLEAAVINGRGDFRIRVERFEAFIDARSITHQPTAHAGASSE